MNNLRVSLLLVCAFVASSNALQCYSCTYTSVLNVGSNCKGPNVASETLLNCTNGITSCNSAKTSVSLLGINTVTIVRSCGTATAGCTSVPGGSKCTTVCTTDGCNNVDNGVGKMKLSMLSLLITGAVGHLLSKL